MYQNRVRASKPQYLTTASFVTSLQSRSQRIVILSWQGPKDISYNTHFGVLRNAAKNRMVKPMCKWIHKNKKIERPNVSVR